MTSASNCEINILTNYKSNRIEDVSSKDLNSMTSKRLPLSNIGHLKLTIGLVSQIILLKTVQKHREDSARRGVV